MVEESAAEDEERDSDSAEPPAQESAEPKAPEETDESSESTGSSGRLAFLLQVNAARLARRMVKSGDYANADFIAETLAISPAHVRTWIASVPAAKAWDVGGLTAELLTIASQA